MLQCSYEAKSAARSSTQNAVVGLLEVSEDKSNIEGSNASGNGGDGPKQIMMAMPPAVLRTDTDSAMPQVDGAPPAKRSTAEGQK